MLDSMYQDENLILKDLIFFEIMEENNFTDHNLWFILNLPLGVSMRIDGGLKGKSEGNCNLP